MSSRDSAFLWETEVLRSARRSTSGARSTRALLDDPDDWVTVREASAATGMSSTTLKKLARSKEIPSHLEKTDDGFLRIVSLEAIRRWNDHREEHDDDAGPSSETLDEVSVDLTESESSGHDVPEGTMLVPLDAWNKMLNQLGNLHEAGQQLAEARERAAKAETEAQFLKERLRELREQLEDPRSPTEQPATADEPAARSGFQATRSLVRKVYTDWRTNRRR